MYISICIYIYVYIYIYMFYIYMLYDVICIFMHIRVEKICTPDVINRPTAVLSTI